MSTLTVRICAGRGFGDAVAFIASAFSGSKGAISSTVKDINTSHFIPKMLPKAVTQLTP